jgi:SAM-dependent methyltransferase
MSIDDISPYYRHSSYKLSLASRLSYAARMQMFDRFMQVMQPSAGNTVLDIGVTSDTTFKESNFFEQLYPYKEQIVCVGTENGSHLEQTYPGVKFIQVEPGQPLPFADKKFDLVFSNAVIEHAGSRINQKAFIAEALRVGKRVFITTPNRWFPVETHTTVPLLHYLPPRLYRSVLKKTSLKFWSSEQNLNLLTKTGLANLFPPGCRLEIERIGIAPGLFKSNVVAYTISQAQ